MQRNLRGAGRAHRQNADLRLEVYEGHFLFNRGDLQMEYITTKLTSDCPGYLGIRGYPKR